jgi:hypothetical protein
VHAQHRLVLAQQQGLVHHRQVNELSVAIHSSLSAASADLSGRAAGSSKTKASSTTRKKLGSEHTITLGAFRLDAVTTKKNSHCRPKTGRQWLRYRSAAQRLGLNAADR